MVTTDRNEALVREAYEAYRRGDVAGMLEFVDPELEWTYLDPALENPDPEIAETFGVSRKTVYRHLEPSAGRRQPGKSARPAAPAGPLATLPDPAHDRASEPAARPRARPLPRGPTWPARPARANPPPAARRCSNARTSPSSGCTSTATTSPRPGTAWHASRRARHRR